VYEVTPSDYANIIATEGGGSSYQDILVTCHALNIGSTVVPEKPTTPPFKAHTLFSPALSPPKPGDTAPPNSGHGGQFQRPDPSYAQASARYLRLITSGAEEHNLPQEYKDYLYDIRPYTITTVGQRVGQFIFLTLWAPLVMLMFSLQRLFQDKKGRSPKWLKAFMGALFTAVWASYDHMFKRIFGDGERTIYEDERAEEKKVKRTWYFCKSPGSRCDEEQRLVGKSEK